MKIGLWDFIGSGFYCRCVQEEIYLIMWKKNYFEIELKRMNQLRVVFINDIKCKRMKGGLSKDR